MFNIKKSFYKFNLLISVLILIFTLVITVGTTYAWFASRRSVAETEFKSGEFDTSLQLQYWNKASESANKWTSVPTSGIGAAFFPSFGNLSDISQLPEDCTVYLKMKVFDNSGARYIYDISVETININIYQLSDGVYQQITDNAMINGINYYSDVLAQSCIDSYYISSQNNNLIPNQLNQLFTLNAVQITAENHSFSQDVFVAENEWMYVKLTLRQTEVFNIIRQVPPVYMPYGIEFMLSIKSEIRTMDYE